ncbi:MAG: flagellin [Deltaproteobacteria bacterium]|nr:flagellin [Deltaproteobacteria bacterium]
MSLRINHNIAAVNSHRNLVRNDARLGRTLEHLSSGMKINRSADGPAALVISEQMRAQVAGLTQAVMNSESAVAMVQTAEAALNEVNSILISMRQLSVHAANEGANDSVMLDADQAELINSLDSIDRISKSTQFGTRTVLDGSNGVSGIATGEDLTYEGATTRTKSSPQSGYSVKVTQEATQSQLVGAIAMSQAIIDAGEKITLMEGGRSVEITANLGESLTSLQSRINSAVEEAGLKLDVYFDIDGKFTVLHREYGSEHSFGVSSSTGGIASDKGNTPMQVQNGIDIQGSIGNEVANGRGQVLTGGIGTNVEGLKVRFTGVSDPENPEVGRLGVQSNALVFQVGGNANQTVRVLLPSTKSDTLAVNVNNESGFRSLRDLDIRNAQGAQDAMKLIEDAINQVTSTRAEMGAMQKNALESNIVSLGVAKENLLNAESVIRDTDMAAEMSEFTKYQIMTQAATAMLAQANQMPNNVLTLLK